MPDEHPNDPLFGITLKMMLEQLVERHGWEELARRIRIRCFARDPSVSSSLKFLRRTPWARAKVETLYLEGLTRARKRRAAPRKRYRGEAAPQEPKSDPTERSG